MIDRNYNYVLITNYNFPDTKVYIGFKHISFRSSVREQTNLSCKLTNNINNFNN